VFGRSPAGAGPSPELETRPGEIAFNAILSLADLGGVAGGERPCGLALP